MAFKLRTEVCEYANVECVERLNQYNKYNQRLSLAYVKIEQMTVTPNSILVGYIIISFTRIQKLQDYITLQ